MPSTKKVSPALAIAGAVVELNNTRDAATRLAAAYPRNSLRADTAMILSDTLNEAASSFKVAKLSLVTAHKRAVLGNLEAAAKYVAAARAENAATFSTLRALEERLARLKSAA